MTTEAPSIRTLTCCCCGEYTRGRQWWNRDTGYGLCPSCADWLADGRETPEEMRNRYGERGTHYAINEAGTQPAPSNNAEHRHSPEQSS